MPEAMVQDPMIGEALDLERLFLQNHEERLRYILSYKAMVDDLTIEETIRRAARAEGIAEGEARGKAEGIAEGEAKGKAEGIAEGEAKGITSTARRMLARGVSPEQVADFTGLSLDEVEALKGQMD